MLSGISPGERLLKEYCPRDNTTNQLDIFSTTHELYIRFKFAARQDYSITAQALRGKNDHISVAVPLSLKF